MARSLHLEVDDLLHVDVLRLVAVAHDVPRLFADDLLPELAALVPDWAFDLGRVIYQGKVSYLPPWSRCSPSCP